MKKALCGIAALLTCLNVGIAGMVTIPDYTSPTLAANGSYAQNHSLAASVSGDTAVYLVSTMEFTNPSGTLASGTMWNQVGAFVPGERTSLGMPARSNKWGILGVGNNSSATTIPLDTPTELVLKIDQVAGQAWMWIAPDLNQLEPDLSTADVMVTNAGITADITQVTYRGGAYSGATNSNIINYTGTALYYGGDTPFAIPEPSTIVLLGMGLLGMAVCGRRRRKAEGARF